MKSAQCKECTVSYVHYYVAMSPFVSSRCLTAKRTEEEDKRKHTQKMEREAQRQQHERRLIAGGEHQLKLKEKEIELAKIKYEMEKMRKQETEFRLEMAKQEAQLKLEMIKCITGCENEQQQQLIQELLTGSRPQPENPGGLEQPSASAVNYNCK